GRMTLCNMVVEFGAWTGIVAPDEVTWAFLKERPFAPKGELWERALDAWRALASDADASFDEEIVVEVTGLAPQVTWGTSSQQSVGVDEAAPDPASIDDPVRRASAEKAL